MARVPVAAKQSSSVPNPRPTSGGLTLPRKTDENLAIRQWCESQNNKSFKDIITNLLRAGAIICVGVSSGDPKPIDLIHTLVEGMQVHCPTATAEIQELEFVYQYHPHEYLPPSLAAASLPSLRALRLTGVLVGKKTLKKLLRAHRTTLREIEMADVARPLRRDGVVVNSGVDDWIEMINFIGTDTEPDYVLMHHLTWCEGVSGEASEVYVTTPHAHMGTRFPPESHDYMLRTDQWWRLSNGGIEVVGIRAVGYGLPAFIDAIEYEKLQPPGLQEIMMSSPSSKAPMTQWSSWTKHYTEMPGCEPAGQSSGSDRTCWNEGMSNSVVVSACRVSDGGCVWGVLALIPS